MTSLPHHTRTLIEHGLLIVAAVCGAGILAQIAVMILAPAVHRRFHPMDDTERR